jgi:hypothetical protein
MADPELVSTKQEDYLDEDKPIRGQNYALISFLSPEDVLKEKEVYYFSKFLDKFGKDMKTLLDSLENKYPDSADLVKTIKSNHEYIFNSDELDEQYKFFKSVNSADIESEYHKKNNFKTSMRGVKIRGVFDTIEEAKKRSEFVKKFDSKFDIYICQVGCWIPWSPNPNDLAEQEYSESQLNTLMKQYKQNIDSKDEMFEERKRGMMGSAKSASEHLEEVDPWTASHQSQPKEEQTIDVKEDVEGEEEKIEEPSGPDGLVRTLS